MKKRLFFTVVGLVLLFFGTSAWAAGAPSASPDLPPILSSLDLANVTPLDEVAIAGIRGQGSPLYVLVKIPGVNALDFGYRVQWTLNPLGYRYGYWGGPDWSNGGDAVAALSSGGGITGVDAMDDLFKVHDWAYINPGTDTYAADVALLDGLESLPKTSVAYWGGVYSSAPSGAPSSVYVSGVSLVGGKLFFGWRAMPYSEYSRREAVFGMSALVLGKTLFSGLRLQ